MGEGTTRVTESNSADDWVRELSTEISAVRRRLDALVKDLDRRRHNVTGWRRHRRPGGRTIAIGLLVAAVVVTAPLALARRRARDDGELVTPGAGLARAARRRLGQALMSDCPAPSETGSSLGSRTAVALATVVAQALVASLVHAGPAARALR